MILKLVRKKTINGKRREAGYEFECGTHAGNAHIGNGDAVMIPMFSRYMPSQEQMTQLGRIDELQNRLHIVTDEVQRLVEEKTLAASLEELSSEEGEEVGSVEGPKVDASPVVSGDELGEGDDDDELDDDDFPGEMPPESFNEDDLAEEVEEDPLADIKDALKSGDHRQMTQVAKSYGLKPADGGNWRKSTVTEALQGALAEFE